MKDLTSNEANALLLLREHGKLTIGMNISRQTRAKFGLGNGQVLPSVAAGLERRGLATRIRPDKRGPAQLILGGTVDNVDEWKRQALVFDVFVADEYRGQVAALSLAEAEAIARETFVVKTVTLACRGALYRRA